METDEELVAEDPVDPVDLELLEDSECEELLELRDDGVLWELLNDEELEDWKLMELWLPEDVGGWNTKRPCGGTTLSA